eukprot:4932649-Amphidinium_carterae.1
MGDGGENLALNFRRLPQRQLGSISLPAQATSCHNDGRAPPRLASLGIQSRATSAMPAMSLASMQPARASIADSPGAMWGGEQPASCPTLRQISVFQVA